MPSNLIHFTDILRDEILCLLVVAIFLLGAAFYVLFSRVSRLQRSYSRLVRNTSGGNIEEMLVGHMDTVRRLETRTDATEREVVDLNARQRRCLQRIGLVRFDAFEEVGGQQSFAVVLMDAEESGVALSTVFSRSDVRVYAKAIHQGEPTHALTHEERLAVQMADGARK